MMTDEQIRSLVIFYVKEIKHGTKKLEQVPEVLREKVEKELNESN